MVRRLMAGLTVAVAVAAGCASSGQGSSSYCTSGTCVPEGGFSDAGYDGPVTCGDRRCDGTETCVTCSLDCGECPACPLAPTCSDALGAPANPTPRPDLYQGTSAPDAGADAGPPPSELPGTDGCQDAQLRMRLVSIETYAGGATIFCIVDGNDGSTSEVAITPMTGSLGDNQSFYFDPATSMFWGQMGLHATTDNLTITYNCFTVVDNSAWSAALMALGQAAMQAGGIAGPYGWAFGAASAGAQAAAAAIMASNGAKLTFNAQQTIAKGELMDLTNGRMWKLRESGGGLLSMWDWELTVESWGCAFGVAPPP